MTGLIISGLLVLLGGAISATHAQGPLVLYDPVAKVAEKSFTEADEQIVREKLAARHRSRTSDVDEACRDAANLNVIGAVEGTFTRTGASQRVIVYELCQTGNGFAKNGLAVIENGDVVAHYSEDGGWNLEVSRVPDLNNNGRDEIVIETGGGMHQGYTGSSVTILEFSGSGLMDLGTFLVYTNECENYAPNKYCDRSYKLTALPGAKPAFMTQKYVNGGTAEKPRWVKGGKPVAATAIGGLTKKYKVVI